ncbi:MAG: acetyl-CoA C-acyltransferase, partial [Thermoplasmata archaeon]|nr:acetyl-CoA C-acyltransferase [Candidatus Sysuiplasma superficiale]
MSELHDVYIVHYTRTAFSRSRPNDPAKDAFNDVRMDYALSRLMKRAVTETSVDPAWLDDVIIGCAYQRDENWTFGGRHPVFLSNFPTTVPSMAVDRACSSSLNAMSVGAMEIMTGNSQIVLSGGFEHMTHVPRLSNKLCDVLLSSPEYAAYRMDIGYHMGLTAEKLAHERGIGRGEMDEYSLRSHMLASRAVENGFLKGEITPV